MAETEIEVMKVRPEPRSGTAVITFVVAAFALFLGVVIWTAIKLGPNDVVQTQQLDNPTSASQ